MRDIMHRIFDTSRYNDLVEESRAQMVYQIAAFVLILVTIYFSTGQAVLGGQTTWQNGASHPIRLFAVVLFYGLILATMLATRWGQVDLGGIALVASILSSIGLIVIEGGLYDLPDGLVLGAIILVAGMLFGNRGLLFGALAALTMLAIGIYLRTNIPVEPPRNSGDDLLNTSILLLATGGTIYLYLRQAQIMRAEGIRVAIEERLKLANLTTSLNELVAQRVTLDELLTAIAGRIVADFPEIYHAQIFLLDPSGQRAELAASTGEVGQILISRGHFLTVGSISVIGQVTLKGEPVVSRAGDVEGVHRRNELLLDTRIEAAFPLQIGDRIIGALDLQSRQDDAFPNQAMEAFSSLTARIALTIDNVRQFERAEARFAENQKLVEQTRKALHEVERLNDRLTGRAWSEYLGRQRIVPGLNVDFSDGKVQHDNTWTPAMIEAAQDNHLVQTQQGETQILSVPLHVRGQVIGALEFELDAQQALSPEDLTLIQEITERSGLTAENTRLVDESQHIAQREALVYEISGRLQATNNIETTLTEAARSLRDALKANKIAIRLGSPPGGNGQ